MRRHFRERKGDKVKTVTFPVFSNYRVIVVFTHSFEKAYKRFEHTKGAEPLQNAQGITCHIHDTELSYIFILYGEDTGVMVHEAYHAIRHMFEEHNIEMTNENVAHHLGYLVNEIVELALR